jgi:hypothetical protein
MRAANKSVPAKKVDTTKRDGQTSLFGKMVLAIGGSSLATALVFGTVWPIVLGALALFGILSFMNGLV